MIIVIFIADWLLYKSINWFGRFDQATVNCPRLQEIQFEKLCYVLFISLLFKMYLL